jgi:hypothetical protein
MKPIATTEELKQHILAEILRSPDHSDVDPGAILVVRKPAGWWATLREGGSRVDEARLATVAEIGRRLGHCYTLAPAG